MHLLSSFVGRNPTARKTGESPRPAAGSSSGCRSHAGCIVHTSQKGGRDPSCGKGELPFTVDPSNSSVAWGHPRGPLRAGGFNPHGVTRHRGLLLAGLGVSDKTPVPQALHLRVCRSLHTQAESGVMCATAFVCMRFPMDGGVSAVELQGM